MSYKDPNNQKHVSNRFLEKTTSGTSISGNNPPKHDASLSDLPAGETVITNTPKSIYR